MSNPPIIISGAGLVGSLLSIMLKQRGYDVVLFEKRSDMRNEQIDGGRSINLVVTSRGINALCEVDLWEKVREITVPVIGRMIHSIAGETTFQPYGKDRTECNYSVSRGELNKLLMSEAESLGVPIYFEHALEKVNFKESLAEFRVKNESLKSFEFVKFFGADGAGSITRKELLKMIPDSEESMDLLASDYKELFMPASGKNTYPMDKDSLHIWPRGSHMLMGLANLDGSFTMTLYLHKSNDEVAFDKIKNKEDVKILFEKYYPDAIPLMPDYQENYFENPQGILGTVRCYPWHFEDRGALFGDAAHAIVPFFGQGMNCGFEDISVLSSLMDKYKNDWSSILKNYSKIQKENGDAIADMAIENFTEMKESVGNEKFLLRKKVEGILEKELPNLYRTRYAMVTYTLIPYHLAQKAGIIQNEILDQLCENLTSLDELDLDLARKLIEEKFTPFIKENDIKLERYKI